MAIQLANYPNNRILPFEGVLNFRDMGGYETTDGRKVKYGLFFRSAELTGMTANDLELFQSLGIKTIFDYRSDGEAEQKPDPVIEGVKNIRIPAMKQDVPADMRELMRQGHFKGMTPDMLAAMYVEMAVNNPSYRSLMTTIMNLDHLGVLHHCAGGRDRTGVGGAIILLALGVPEETIIEDYLISNTTLIPMNEKIKQQLSEFMSPEEADRIVANMELRREFMEAVFTTIHKHYGSVSAFLEQEFGMTPGKRAEWQKYCLESN
ncbi:tyrosine-protein phosphatase [Paenibacillus chartarius]|uniref:Tyrosine-protein phosphatase n=1 Tax=Paenibacillus chartarius TaxID=747481 RepID=A0ABV6DS55_9BACL